MTDSNAVVDNRPVVDTAAQAIADASKQDAQTLGRLYLRVSKAVKAHKKAVTNVKEGWVRPDKMDDLRHARDEAQYAMDLTMDEAWAQINSLPAGTVAPGGATPQTVGLQLFNRNLNRNLKARVTATEARDANRRSFG